ncbi:Hypothetical protein CINCED_3A021950 [Cinara cedri]|uniref:Uncharacterized protein n=1 Tax=Cinara cedri TaxID=506608 RepID=A0A5E4M296_9HEMI|nr:Hypothetical protein CINCED_3A021950 [Cinara cedri]
MVETVNETECTIDKNVISKTVYKTSIIILETVNETENNMNETDLYDVETGKNLENLNA